MNLRSLFTSLREKFKGRLGLQHATQSMVWLFSDRIIRMVLGLTISTWLARYLGPEKFGTLSYALAMTALFGVLSGSYLNKIVVRNLVRDSQHANITIGSTFLLRLGGSFIALLLAYACVTYLRPNDPLSRTLVAIIATSFLFQSFEVIGLWFESKVNAKPVVIARDVALILAVIVKSTLIITNAPLVAFAWAVLLEIVAFNFFLILVYLHAGNKLHTWRVHGKQLQGLVADGWPLIMSAIMITIYMKIDQLMLGEIIGDKVVGIYSVAVNLAGFWYFIPTIILTAVSPSIIKIRQQSKALYLNRLRILYEFLYLLAFIIAIVVSLTSDFVIDLLYGNDYLDAGPVLTITIWAGVAVFLGLGSNQYLVVENRTKIVFYRTLLGMFTNVALNLLWIPKYGAIGAAYTTLISYFIATYSLLLLGEFKHGLLLIKAVVPLQIITELRNKK